MTVIQERHYNNPINVNLPGYVGTVQLNGTPLSMACANADAEEEKVFYKHLCNLPGSPTASTPCVINDIRLICSLPIACSVFQYHGGGIIWNECDFILFPPSPPPFCCTMLVWVLPLLLTIFSRLLLG